MRLSQFLGDVANGVGPVGWETWFPVSLAAQDAAEWEAAWRPLSVRQRVTVLDRLRADGSVYADTLLQLASRCAGVVDDPPFEELLLGDAADAAVRQTRALESRLAQLRDTLTSTQVDQADLTVRITELEGQLSRFLADRVDSEYGRMVTLERHVARLAEQAAALAGYEWDARQAECTRLGDAVVAGEARRSVLAEELADLQARNVEVKHDLESSTAAVATARAELELRTRDVATAREDLAALEQQIAAGSGEASRVAAERSRAAVRLKEIQEALRRDHSALEELQRSPVRAEAARLAEAIDALFAGLPTDRADGKFPGRPTP